MNLLPHRQPVAEAVERAQRQGTRPPSERPLVFRDYRIVKDKRA